MSTTTEKYLENIRPNDEEYEAISIENVLKEIDIDLLKDIAEQKKMDVYVPKKLKKQCDSESVGKVHEIYTVEFAQVMRRVGVKSTLNSIPKKYMVGLTKNLDQKFLTTDGYNKLSCPVLRKRAFEKMMEVTVRKYFEDYVTDNEFLVELIEYFGRESWSKSGENKDKLIEQLCEIFDSSSLQIFLETLPVGTLNEILKDMEIEVHYTNPKKLADCIVFGSICEESLSESDTENVEINLSRKKPKSINKDCSREDLIHYFNVTELKNFLKSNNLVSSGKKIQLVNIIIQYFDDPETVTKKYNIEERKAKRKQKTQQRLEARERRKIKAEEAKEKRKREREEKNTQEDTLEEDNSTKNKLKTSKKK